MKTKIPYLILTLIICAAQSASAALVFTFSAGAPGSTIITVSGDTATASGSGGTAEAEQIGFSAQGTGSVRQTAFRTRNDGFDYATFASIGSGTLTDTISLTSSGITGGSPTTIDGYQFDGLNFFLVMEINDGTGGNGLANNGDTLSFAGSPDTFGVMPVAFSAFHTLRNTTLNKSDGILFVFAPEPSSSALLGLGLSSLLLRRRRS